MSTKNAPELQNSGTTQDDAPTTLEPQITTVVTDHVANGPADGLLAYDEFCTVVTCTTDTIARVVQEDRER